MNATIGAQETKLAIMPRTIAIVPQEQSGVVTATTVAPTTPARSCFYRNAATFCWLT
jgi:hypothetical protein